MNDPSLFIGWEEPLSPGMGVLPYKSYTGTSRSSIQGMVFDRPLINRVSNSKIFKDLYKQGLKITHFNEKMSGI